MTVEIDAFTSSVGPVYAEYMAKSLPKWASSLDSITLVTMPGDPVVAVAKQYPKVRVIETTLFKDHGAAFNKGAALNLAFAEMDPRDVVLHFDADIEPPDGWRTKVEKEFRSGTIAGSLRFDEHGNKIQDLGSWPYGYFQLWQANDIAVMSWPLLEVWHPSAGGYDLEFLERWPQKQWKKFSFDVKHYGEVRQNWFGVGLPPEEQEEASRRMAEVHRAGLRETRLKTRNESNRLKVPRFLSKLGILMHKPAATNKVCDMVRACMTEDPFLVSIRVVSTMSESKQHKIDKLFHEERHSAEAVRKYVVHCFEQRHKCRPSLVPVGFTH